MKRPAVLAAVTRIKKGTLAFAVDGTIYKGHFPFFRTGRPDR